MKQPYILLLLLLSGIAAFAQSGSITGKITDNTGEALAGVSIVEKGTSNATLSDAGGTFKINVRSPQSVLVFSFVGMHPQEITVGDKTRIEVEMQTSLSALDEVVVVGYGVQKKSDIISSVLSVNTESVNKVPTNDLGEMLEGKPPGCM